MIWRQIAMSSTEIAISLIWIFLIFIIPILGVIGIIIEHYKKQEVMDSITIIGWIITIVGIIYMVSDKSSGARPYNDDDWEDDEDKAEKGEY